MPLFRLILICEHNRIHNVRSRFVFLEIFESAFPLSRSSTAFRVFAFKYPRFEFRARFFVRFECNAFTSLVFQRFEVHKQMLTICRVHTTDKECECGCDFCEGIVCKQEQENTNTNGHHHSHANNNNGNGHHGESSSHKRSESNS
jgi:hypothetical protein